MPEGDTLYRVAHTLHRALAGHVVRRFDAAYAPLLRIDESAPLVGRTVLRVESRGKWCLIWLGPRAAAATTAAGRWDGPLILCTHLRMNGMWHIYRAGPTPAQDERWQRPARDMRVLLATDDFVAVGFRVPVAELLTEEELAGHRDLGRLGPDLLGEPFDEDEALRRLAARGSCALAEALLDQSAVAGIGNVYKSELCFLVGVSPFAPVAAVPPQTLRHLLSIARRLLRENAHAPASGGRDFAAPPVITFTGRRRTTAAMNPGQRLWVYGRGGLPCRRCGTPIAESHQGEAARVTFHCPRCQPAPGLKVRAASP
jgi:endonuclease-8